MQLLENSKYVLLQLFRILQHELLQLLGQSILFDSAFCESATRISSKKSSSVTRINNFVICNLGAKVSRQIHLTRRHQNRPREEGIESVYIGISCLNQYANAYKAYSNLCNAILRISRSAPSLAAGMDIAIARFFETTLTAARSRGRMR